MKKTGAIVILGGMGPEASAKMLEVMVSMAASEFKAKNCQDFPEIIVDSIPVPDFISNKKNIDLASKMLTTRIIRLKNFNVSCFAIACNTAHIMLDALAASTNTPFISMIDAVAAEVKTAKFKTVGLLATPSTIKSSLYQKTLHKLGVKVILPSERQAAQMEMVIRRVIAKTNTKNDSKILMKIAHSLKRNGAQALILGCTELPLVFPKSSKLPTFDSIEILSRSLLLNFFKKGGEK